MKGGYQLINFLGKHLSGDATTVTGVYKALSRSGKAVRIAGLNLSGTMMPEANVNVDLVDDTYIFHVYGYRVEIAPGDQVSISQSDTYDELVEEVSQLNRDLAEVIKWKYIGETTHGGNVNISSYISKAGEFLGVITSYTASGSRNDFIILIPNINLTSDTRYETVGFYRPDNVNASASIGITDSQVKANRVFMNSAEITDYTLKVYYR